MTDTTDETTSSRPDPLTRAVENLLQLINSNAKPADVAMAYGFDLDLAMARAEAVERRTGRLSNDIRLQLLAAISGADVDVRLRVSMWLDGFVTGIGYEQECNLG